SSRRRNTFRKPRSLHGYCRSATFCNPAKDLHDGHLCHSMGGWPACAGGLRQCHLTLASTGCGRGNRALDKEKSLATFTRSDDLQGAEFVAADLRGARFVRADLSGVVMHEVNVDGADIDAPWLSNGDSFLRAHGCDVTPLAGAALTRAFPTPL